MYYETLKQARKQNNLTQEEVAKRLKIPQTQIVRYEKGINEIPLRYFAYMCKLYKLDANKLIDEIINDTQ